MTKLEHVAVHLDNATIARIDALLPGLSEPGHAATRSDALRKALLLGLQRVEDNLNGVDGGDAPEKPAP